MVSISGQGKANIFRKVLHDPSPIPTTAPLIPPPTALFAVHSVLATGSSCLSLNIPGRLLPFALAFPLTWTIPLRDSLVSYFSGPFMSLLKHHLITEDFLNLPASSDNPVPEFPPTCPASFTWLPLSPPPYHGCFYFVFPYLFICCPSFPFPEYKMQRLGQRLGLFISVLYKPSH